MTTAATGNSIGGTADTTAGDANRGAPPATPIGSGEPGRARPRPGVGQIEPVTRAVRSDKESDLLSGPLGDEFVAVPITVQQMAAPIRICVVMRREPDPVAGYLVLRQDLLESKIYLGCITDARGEVLEYVDLWVQDLELLATSAKTLTLCREALSNTILDDRWRLQCQMLARACPWTVINTGWEETHPLPTLLDVEQFKPLHLGGNGSTGHGQASPNPIETAPGDLAWTLCTDDELLISKRLPAYSRSLARYLYQAKLGASSQFIPVTAEAERNGYTIDLEEVLPPHGTFVKFNVAAGLMSVRLSNPAGVEDLVRVLGGGHWNGLPHGRSHLRTGPLPIDSVQAGRDEPDRTSASEAGSISRRTAGWLTSGTPARSSARFIEIFYHKVRLLADMFEQVRAMTKQAKRPLLNLRPDSFRISCPPAGAGMPALWNCRVVLVDPGDAVPLKIPLHDSDAMYYISGKAAVPNVYQPGVVNTVQKGEGTYFAEHAVDSDRGFILQGTFFTKDIIKAAENDIIFMRLNIANQRVDLYAKLDKRNQYDEGELHFSSIGQPFPQHVKEILTKSIGLQFQDVPYEIIPLLSSACDLYSLGVLAIEVMMGNPKVPLARTVLSMTKLARRLRPDYDEKTKLHLRIQAVFDREKEFWDVLGPQHLIQDPITREQALEHLPEELWWDVLALIVRCFAGEGPDSHCRDYGDAPLKGMHLVYDQPLATLESLIERSRSLLFVDWNYNRDVNAVIQKLQRGLPVDEKVKR